MAWKDKFDKTGDYADRRGAWRKVESASTPRGAGAPVRRCLIECKYVQVRRSSWTVHTYTPRPRIEEWVLHSQNRTVGFHDNLPCTIALSLTHIYSLSGEARTAHASPLFPTLTHPSFATSLASFLCHCTFLWQPRDGTRRIPFHPVWKNFDRADHYFIILSLLSFLLFFFFFSRQDTRVNQLLSNEIKVSHLDRVTSLEQTLERQNWHFVYFFFPFFFASVLQVRW